MTTDEAVLSYIGRQGRSSDDVLVRFPGFDVKRLIRAHLVEIVTSGHADPDVELHRAAAERYILTERGAAAIGLSIAASRDPSV